MRFVFLLWASVLLCLGQISQSHSAVIISEFMADNASSVQDEEGDYPDWIELYNSGPSAVSLKGWFLSDEPGNLAKWVFPDVSIGPREFLIVFASNKNRKIPGLPLHANF